MKQNELILNLAFEKSFEVSFKSKFLTSFPKTKIEKVALLVSNEYEGIYKNGGIGTYYTALSQKLAAEGWYVMLLLTNTDSNFSGKSKLPALKHVFSTHEVKQVLHLQPVHLDILSKVQPYVTDYQSFCCLFFLQAVVNTFKDAHVYAEFHELNGIGYRPIQAKNSALLGHNCVTAVTIHSGHEWIFEANERFIEDYPSWFWHVCHCEQYSFENADLAFFPSHYLKSKVESYGWKTSHALHFPYFIPLIKLVEKNESSHPKENLKNEKIPLIFFGRLEERKGFCTFVEAIKLLPANLLDRIHIVFLGKVVPLQSSELQHLTSKQYIIQTLGSEFSYSLYPNFFSKEAIEFVSNSHHPLVCLTSAQENFPNTALEMGQLPVSLVVSDTGGFRETLKLIDRSSGVHWFQPANSQSLSQVIAQAISTYPENLQIPDRASLEQVNQHLLHQRLEYINHAFSKPALTQQPKKVTIGVICSQLSTDLLDCLKSLDVQTYKYLEVIVLEAADNDDCMHELIAQAKSLFPHYKFLKYDPTLAREAARNHLFETAQGEYFLPFPSSNVALPFMVEKLVSAIRESNAAVVVCPQAKIGTSIDFNFLGGSLPQLLNFNQDRDVCCFFSWELLQELQLSNYNVTAHNWQILAAAVATGKRITYYTYPIYLSRESVDSTISPTSLPREQYFLRQYLSQIEPSKWSQRQLYMLITAVQQLLHSEVLLRSQVTAMQNTKLWKLRVKWFKLRHKIQKVLGRL